MKKLLLVPLLSLVMYIAFMGMAIAGNAVVPAEDSVVDMIKPVFDAVMTGQWWLVASLALILVVTATKRYSKHIPKVGEKVSAFVNGQYGQPLTVLLLSFGGAIATAAAASGTVFVMTGALAWTAFKVAIGAAGGYSLLKSLLVPVLQKIGAKAPAPLKVVIDLLMWVFSKPTAVQKAEAAGDAAVATKPAEGAPKSDVTEI